VSARHQNYPELGSEVRLPAALWRSSLRTLRDYGALKSEGLVYLAGVVAAPKQMVVTSVLALGHQAQGGTVVVTKEEARWLLRTLRSRDEKLFAQVHSHAGAAFHSGGDDDHATSFHTGFLSVVVPRFGSGIERIEQCAVHEYRKGRFEELPAEDVARRFDIFDPEVDRGPPPRAVQPPWWSWRRYAKRPR